MSDRAALLAAISANPEDDTPRLVFADWLDEQSDEKDAKRAAYIRREVDTYRREHADTPAAALHDFLSESAGNLEGVDWSSLDPELAALAPAVPPKDLRFRLTTKTDPLPKVRGVTFGYPERGFFTGILVAKPRAFLANAEAILRAAPLTRINFEGLDAEEARDFVNAGHLGRFRTLKLGSVEPEAIRVLGDHRDAAGISKLEVIGGIDSDDQCEQLAAGANWKDVASLLLGDLDTGDVEGQDELVVSILRRPGFRKLRKLVLFGNELGDRTARVIATAGLTELRTLDLAINSIGDEGLQALAASKTLPNLRYLDFSLNDAGGKGISAVLVAPRLASLTALRLDGSYTGGLDAKTLERPSRGPTLRGLHLENAEVSSRAMAAFAKCKATQGLWYLSLDTCKLADAAIREFTRSDGFRQLTVLDLSHNGITTTGIADLAKWPAMSSVRWLGLNGKKIPVAGAKSLTASEHTQQLKRLLIEGKGKTHLQQHFGKKVVP